MEFHKNVQKQVDGVQAEEVNTITLGELVVLERNGLHENGFKLLQ